MHAGGGRLQEVEGGLAAMLRAGLCFQAGKQANGSPGGPASISAPGTLQLCQEMDGLQEPVDVLTAWGKKFEKN